MLYRLVWSALISIQCHAKERHYANIDEWIRMRCSLNPMEDTIVEWSGPVYALEPQQKQKYLFDVYGINLARCWWNRTEEQYYFSSRELQYYLDQDKKPLKTWKNPWTNETLNVVHTANDPVQFAVGTVGYMYWLNGNDQATFPSNINLFYENPLQCSEDPEYHNKHGDCQISESRRKKFLPYSHQEFYESTELFDFFVDESVMKDATVDSAPLHFSWSRFSQFMPWMKMEMTKGSLLFTAHGGKVNFDTVPDWLKDEVSNRIPIYRHSPRCYENANSVTSWTYFDLYYDEYLAGDQFPIGVTEEPACLLDEITQYDRRPVDEITSTPIDEITSTTSSAKSILPLIGFYLINKLF